MTDKPKTTAKTWQLLDKITADPAYFRHALKLAIQQSGALDAFGYLLQLVDELDRESPDRDSISDAMGKGERKTCVQTLTPGPDVDDVRCELQPGHSCLHEGEGWRWGFERARRAEQTKVELAVDRTRPPELCPHSIDPGTGILICELRPGHDGRHEADGWAWLLGSEPERLPAYASDREVVVRVRRHPPGATAWEGTTEPEPHAWPDPTAVSLSDACTRCGITLRQDSEGGCEPCPGDDRIDAELCDCDHTAEQHAYVGDHIGSECSECSCTRFKPWPDRRLDLVQLDSDGNEKARATMTQTTPIQTSKRSDHFLHDVEHRADPDEELTITRRAFEALQAGCQQRFDLLAAARQTLVWLDALEQMGAADRVSRKLAGLVREALGESDGAEPSHEPFFCMHCGWTGTQAGFADHPCYKFAGPPFSTGRAYSDEVRDCEHRWPQFPPHQTDKCSRCSIAFEALPPLES